MAMLNIQRVQDMDLQDLPWEPLQHQPLSRDDSGILGEFRRSGLGHRDARPTDYTDWLFCLAGTCGRIEGSWNSMVCWWYVPCFGRNPAENRKDTLIHLIKTSGSTIIHRAVWHAVIFRWFSRGFIRSACVAWAENGCSREWSVELAEDGPLDHPRPDLKIVTCVVVWIRLPSGKLT